MFLISTYYNGISVSDMRSFASKKKAKAYWDSLMKSSHDVKYTGGVRAYKTSEDKEPKLLRTDKHWEKA